MQNADKIQVGDLSRVGEIDWRKASRCLRVPRDTYTGQGKVVVEMIPPPARIGNLLLTDSFGANLRSDVGVVLSPSFETETQGKTVRSPEPGTVVCTTADSGCWIDNDPIATKVWNEARQKYEINQIRVFGHYCETEGVPLMVDWWLSIPCTMEDGKIKAQGDRVVLRRDPIETMTDAGLYLPDMVQTRGAMATVLSAGPLAHDLCDGDRVCFDPNAVEQTFSMDESLKDLAVMPVAGINYMLAKELATA